MRSDPRTGGPADHRDATEIATAAGAMLRGLQRELLASGRPAGEVRHEADRVANDMVLRLLAARHPDDPVLSEEAPDEPDRLSSRRVWIVDPLDGTWGYAEGRDDWGVNIALVVDGVPVAGAVAVPALGGTLTTEHPGVVPPREGRPVVVVSRSRPPAGATAVAGRLHAELRVLGSAAAKAAAVVRGEADVYLHSGGMHEWDSAGPVALARACGLHTSRIDGSPLRYNRPDPTLPDLVICRPELAPDVLAAVRDVA